MSIAMMSACWKRFHAQSATEMLVLLALADWADDDGVVWPSVQTIAHKVRANRVTVQRILAKFARHGIIRTVERGGIWNGRNQSSRRQIVPDAFATYGGDGVAEDVKGAALRSPGGGLRYAAPGAALRSPRGCATQPYSSSDTPSDTTPPTPSEGETIAAGAARRSPDHAAPAPVGPWAGDSAPLGSDEAWEWIAQRIAMFDVVARRSARKGWEAIARTIAGPDCLGEEAAQALREAIRAAADEAERLGWPPRRRPSDIRPGIIRQIMNRRRSA